MCEMLKGVRAETATFDGVPPIQLNTEGCVEVDLVVSGRGIHRIPGQIVPCKAGDVCVLAPQTLHGYEAEGNEDGPTVTRILFAPDLVLSGEAGLAEHPRFCYGVFCEGATVAYAL